MSVHEVKCINRTEHKTPHERIRAIGGIYANGTTWNLSQTDAISEIEKGNQRFYVRIDAKRVNVIVARTWQGDKYLKTEIDHEQPCRLLSLYECQAYCQETTPISSSPVVDLSSL